MQGLEVSGAVRLIYKSLGVKGLNQTRITGTLHEDLCTFMIISRSFLRMRNVLRQKM